MRPSGFLVIVSYFEIRISDFLNENPVFVQARNTDYSAEFDPAPNVAYKGKIAHFPWQ
jgi:hypothetical protein